MKLQRRPWPTRPLTLLPGHGPKLRLGAWPTDAAVGHLVVLDHEHVPASDELAEMLDLGRRRGLRSIRTGALFPRTAEAVLAHGFVPVDSLVLLRLSLAGVAPTTDRRSDDRSAAAPTVQPLRRRQHRAASEVDQAAFGPVWGYDPNAVAEVRRATPAHRARAVAGRRRLEGYAISGAGAATGYLQRLAVRPDVRRRGIASALVTDSLDWMTARGVDHVLVNTSADNRPALALYERLGFDRMLDRLTVAEFRLDEQPSVGSEGSS